MTKDWPQGKLDAPGMFLIHFFYVIKGQLISKCLFVDFHFFQKMNKYSRIVVKKNSFVSFLEEFTAWQFAFKINWPLVSGLDTFGCMWAIFFTDSKWKTDRSGFLISKGNYKQMVSNASYLVS